MTHYTHNQPAAYGLYVSARHLDVRFVGSDGETLQGREGVSYRHLPTWFIVLLGPALGAAFVLAFPLLVIAAVVGTAAAAAATRVASARHAYVAHSAWRPAAAYFDGKSAAPEATETCDDPELAALEAEVAVRAAAEKRLG